MIFLSPWAASARASALQFEVSGHGMQAVISNSRGAKDESHPVIKSCIKHGGHSSVRLRKRIHFQTVYDRHIFDESGHASIRVIQPVVSSGRCSIKREEAQNCRRTPDPQGPNSQDAAFPEDRHERSMSFAQSCNLKPLDWWQVLGTQESMRCCTIPSRRTSGCYQDAAYPEQPTCLVSCMRDIESDESNMMQLGGGPHQRLASVVLFRRGHHEVRAVVRVRPPHHKGNRPGHGTAHA